MSPARDELSFRFLINRVWSRSGNLVTGLIFNKNIPKTKLLLKLNLEINSSSVPASFYPEKKKNLCIKTTNYKRKRLERKQNGTKGRRK